MTQLPATAEQVVAVAQVMRAAEDDVGGVGVEMQPPGVCGGQRVEKGAARGPSRAAQPFNGGVVNRQRDRPAGKASDAAAAGDRAAAGSVRLPASRLRQLAIRAAISGPRTQSSSHIV